MKRAASSNVALIGTLRPSVMSSPRRPDDLVRYPKRACLIIAEPAMESFHNFLRAGNCIFQIWMSHRPWETPAAVVRCKGSADASEAPERSFESALLSGPHCGGAWS